FLRQPLRRQLAQLVVHQREQLRRGVAVALFDGRQDACDFTQGRHRVRKTAAERLRSDWGTGSGIERLRERPTRCASRFFPPADTVDEYPGHPAPSPYFLR